MIETIQGKAGRLARTASDYGTGDSVWKDVAAGAIGGLAASWAMSLAMRGSVEVMKRRIGEDVEEYMVETPRGEKPTEKVASVVAEKTMSRRLTRRQKDLADPIVHYVFGAALGALYGALSSRAPVIGSGGGLTYGAAVWLGASGVAMPALRLSKSPTEYPAMTHGMNLAGHLIYGGVLDAVCRFARRVF